MQYYEFRAMNTRILLAAECPFPMQVFEMVQNFIQQCEERFSRFKETSELAALNRSAGTLFSVSPEMLELLVTSLELHEATKQIFDPSILPDLRAAGYTWSFDQLREHTVDAVSEDSRAEKEPFSAMEIDSLHGQVYLPSGMQIDLGGIAKGWIAEQAAGMMMVSGCTACAVNAGGDLFLIGQPDGRTEWEIGLEDPQDRNVDLMVIHVKEGAVATSSVAKRRWRQGDIEQHHLIDPRTGKPAQTPWLSVTAFAPKAAQAETFAKALLIGGPENTQSLLENHPEISFIAIDTQRQLWKSLTEVEKIYEYDEPIPR